MSLPVEDTNNLYLNTARYYDMDTASYSQRDLAFYLDYATRRGGRVLELACGTGRVTLPLLHAGLEVWALDLSEPMLDELSAKARQLPSELQERLHVRHGSMDAFAFDRVFDLIIVPFRGFQALIDEERIDGCLSCVRRHLAPGGEFIVNTFATRMKEHLKPYTGELTDWERRDPRSGEWVRRARRILGVDRDRQVLYPEVIYYVSRDGRETGRFSDRLALRYYYEYQLQVRLLASGFRIAASYGDFDRRPVDTGTEFIYVCRHSVGLPALGS
ncbi:MAG: class I SAM-dependent methyltransferase [Spirochaetales bacterium]